MRAATMAAVVEAGAIPSFMELTGRKSPVFGLTEYCCAYFTIAVLARLSAISGFSSHRSLLASFSKKVEYLSLL